MARERITPGTVGTVSVVPVGTTPDGDTEQVIPAPLTDGGEPLPYPKKWRAGGTYKVATSDGVQEWTLTRWRGLARVVDVDGSQYQVRRWRGTKAAAENATEQAGLEKLAALAAARDNAAAALAQAAEGDTTTTVGDLLRAVFETPAYAKLAPRTAQEYRYRLPMILAHDSGTLAAMLPRNVDVAAVRSFLISFAQAHGRSSAAQAKAILRRAMDIATETAALRVPFNPVLVTRDAVPDVTVRPRRDTKHVPTDAEVSAFLAALQRDPMAAPMIGPRRKSRHGEAGSVVNGADVADLLAFTYGTGARIGEASGLRWGDLVLAPGAGTADVTGTVVALRGVGTVRQERTKTKRSTRTVPLSDGLVELLLRRAELFGVNLTDDEQLAHPVFPSPQHHDRWREQRNLQRAIRDAYARHGLDYATSHTARRWRVTSLLDRSVAVGKVADVVGHTQVATTMRYVGRGRATDEDVRAAL